MIKRITWILCLFLLNLRVAADTRGSDWPTYLHDHARTGSTSARLKLPLGERWVYTSPSLPKRAWSGPEGRTVERKELRDRVKFDDALQVAIVADRVYFGSPVDHQVHCINLQTGEELWRFFTGGPIRLAPTVIDGHVYIGSDDGYAYCLDDRNGKLVWKLRLGPAEESIIARGEMISRWPVRTGVLVDNGIAFFGAGIFPHENVYLCAADAKDGKIIWKNDKISHMDAGRNDLSPQGYLLATENQLYVPSSRSVPVAVDPRTGQLIGANTDQLRFTKTAVAGTDGVVADGRLQVFSLGTRLAVAGKSSYVLTGNQLMRINRMKYVAAKGQFEEISSELRDLSEKLPDAGDKTEEYKQRIAELKQKADRIDKEAVYWRAPCTAEAALVIAGDLVLAGGEGQVAAFQTETGQEVWTTSVDGQARGLAVVEGNLLVSTTTGKIYCLADAEATTANVVESTSRPSISPYPQDEWSAVYQRAAEEILNNSKVNEGFCLVVGSEQGRLAYELAQRSKLKIYGIEPDEGKVKASRRALSAAGLYGHRVTVHQGDLSADSYSNYFANLIVSDRLLRTGHVPGVSAEVVRHLKPAGGVIVLGQPDDVPGPAVTGNALREWLKGTGLGDNSTETISGSWVTLTRGTLPGAGNWSHQYAEPGNTASSGDRLVKGGLGILWYGDPGPGQMVNRHQGAVGPLVVNGRLFIQGTNSLMAYDTYNGLFLWEYENPQAIRTGVFQNNAPGNLAASDDSLFHMIRNKVIEHDAATGRVKVTHEIPPSIDSNTHTWGYVAYQSGRLIGTATIREAIARADRRRGNPGTDATDTIFAIDAKTGEHLWAYSGKSIAHHTIALGPDRVFFIDSSVTSDQRAAILRQDKARLETLTGEAAQRAEERLKALDVRLAVALDANTGEQLWSKPVDVTDCSEIGIGGGKLTLIYRDRVLLLCGANANGHYWEQFVAGEFSRRRLVALSSADGYKLWSQDANYRHRPIIIGDRVIAEPWAFDLHSGKQQMRIHPVTGLQVPWSIMRPGHHCGMLTGCESMLMFRSGYTGFYDLEADAGTRHFAGHRLGCWINAIPTNGVVVIPEASAGCVCMFSIASTIVMEPRTARRPWSIYSGVGATTPVQQLALNLGAPGDRRDQQGKLWLAYPRPTPNPGLETSLDLALALETQFMPQGEFFSNDGDTTELSPLEGRWITSSGARGLTRCSLPLLGKDDKPAVYQLRLCFSKGENDKSSQRVFDVQVQGQTMLENVDAAAEAEVGEVKIIREIKDIEVTDSLVIDLIPKTKTPSGFELPILSAIEVVRSTRP